MVIRGKGAQPTDARPWVQAAAWVLLFGAAPLLAGCSSVPSSINPVSWWHNLQGGEIAKQRPPPPGVNQPYPNLATIPPRPEAPDQKALEAITQGLVADRAHAEYLAAAAPLPDPSSPAASPALFGQGTMPPAPAAIPGAPASVAGTSAPAASATLPAASAPPMPSGPPPTPSPAPRRPVQSEPLAPPAAAAAVTQRATAGPSAGPASGASSAGAPPSPAARPPASAASAAPSSTASANARKAPAPNLDAALDAPRTAPMPAPSGPLPPVPATPPSPPKLSGPGAPGVVVATAAPPPPAAPQASSAVTVEFVPGSAALPPGATDILKGVAAKRGAAVVAVTGYGDAASTDPDVQTAALTLGLSRAQAVANALASDGVPATAVRVGAEASGRGASVRLVQ